VYHVMRVLLPPCWWWGTVPWESTRATPQRFSGSVRAALYQRLHPAACQPLRTGEHPAASGDILARFYASAPMSPLDHQDGASPV